MQFPLLFLLLFFLPTLWGQGLSNSEATKKLPSFGNLIIDKNWNDLTHFFSQKLKSSPSSHEAKLGWALALYQEGLGTDAHHLFSELIPKADFHFETHFNLGIIYFHEKNVDLSLKHFLHAKKIRPSFVETHLYLARLYESKNQFDQAQKSFLAALANTPQTSPDTVSILVALSDFLLRRGRIVEAEEELWKAIYFKPKSYFLLFKYAGLLEEQSKDEQAMRSYAAILKLVPSHREARLRLAWLQLPRQRKLALENFKLLHKDRPQDQEALIGISHYYQLELNYALAMDYLVLAERTGQNAKVHEERAQLFIKMRKFDEALREYEMALKYSPDLEWPHFFRAQFYSYLGVFESAQLSFQEALKHRPNSLILNYHLANLLYENKKCAEAIPYYEKVLELSPMFERAHYNIAVCQLEQNNLEHAEKHLRPIKVAIERREKLKFPTRMPAQFLDRNYINIITMLGGHHD